MTNRYFKIAIITCWFGEYPWYFPYFVHTCSFNPTIDFYILTDNQEKIANKPDNIKIIPKTLKEINNLANEKLGFKVTIDRPYKLCDFKPTYGLLFSDILQNYDFWGHGDVDIFYGDIRAFMTKKILSKYDIISSRHDFFTGSFGLYKNNEQMNWLFSKSKDYKKVMTGTTHFSFGECNFLFKEMVEGKSILDFKDNIESMTYVIKKAEKEGEIKAFFDFIIIESIGDVKWENGKIYFKEKFEGLYYNLVAFKNFCKIPPKLEKIPNKFYVTETEVILELPSKTRKN